ncbi:tenascin-X isoform X6 [Gopherus flavomarginatus]|uniref:tenascin-X isoform X6 n=1 Tax=Gopherus flavomarginatus TaxID=286002 RepID=UPI0021CBCFE3|nr:tenascin-X isoform X6 [Gopherus flavomarginatus]
MPTLPPPGRLHPEPTRPSVARLRPPGPAGKPGPRATPANASSLPSQLFFRTMAQNLTAKLARYNGTLLQRLESYLRATRYPLRGNQTIASVARTIYLYLVHRKSLEEQEMVYVGLGQHSKELGVMAPTLGHPAEEPTGPPGHLQIAGKEGGIFSEGSPGWATGPRGHAKPAVVAHSPGAIVVSLEGMRGHAERMVVRYWRVGDGGGAGELAVPGDAAAVRLHGLAPGTTYQVEIHGLVQGRLSKSYSFVASTAPEASGTEPPPTPSLSRPGPPPGDLAVTDVSSDRFRVTWTATTGTFQHFVLQYQKPGSRVPPGQTQVPGGKRSVILTQLSPGTEYEVELRGVAPDGTISEPITTSVSTAPLGGGPGPSDLGALGVRNVTSDGFGLQWRAPKALFQSFLLRYEDAAGRMGPREAEVPEDQRATRVGGLRPGTEYNVTLYGVHRGQLSPPLRARVRTAPAEPGTQPSLGELSASNVTHDSALLSWTVQAGDFDSFLLQYKDAEGKPQALPVDGGSRTVTVTNLAPSRRYKFNLYGISGRKRLGPVSTDSVTAKEPREPELTPQPSLGELSASDVTHDSTLLSWTVQAGDFDSFLLQYKDTEGKPQALPMDGGSRTVTVTNLAPSHRYKFNLYGISGRKRLGPISTDTVTAAAPPKEVPTTQPSLGELSASDVTHDSILLSWTVQAGDFDSFLLQYKDAEGKPQALPMDWGSRTVTVTNLAPSRRYKFNLYGISGRKRLGPISTDAITVAVRREEETTAKPSLGELSASDVTHDSIRLSWTVQAGDFDSFLLQYKDAEGKPQALPVDGESRTVTVTNLAPSHRYNFKFYGVSGRKRLGPISTNAVTATAPTEAVPTAQPSLGELSASDVTHDSILLSWTIQAGDFDSFLLQYKDAEGKPQALPVDGGSRTVTVTNLAPSRRYKFNLYGIYGRKRLGPVSTDTVTAMAPQEEAVGMQLRLGELSAANAVHDSIDLSWTVEEGTFDSFILQYRDAEGNPRALPLDGALRSLHLHDLAPSHRYKFNLYGISGRKRLGPVSTDAVTAAAPTEAVPTAQPSLGELSASNITHDSILLSWTVQAGDFDSFLLQYKNMEGKPQALPVDGGSRTVTINSLAPSRRYKFNLYGMSGRKRLGPVSTDAVTAPWKEEPAPQPSLGELSASDVTHDSIRLSWTIQGGDFDSFILQYKDMEGKLQALPMDGGSRTVTVTNLAPSRRYKFNLYGIYGRKRLGPVSTDTVTASAPTEEVPTAQPSLGELSASNVTHDSIRLSWTIQTGDFDSFLLQYKDTEGKPQALPVDGGSRTVTVTNLAPSHRYKFNLYGISGRKRLGPISTDTITAPTEEVPTPQPSLGELLASNVTHDSIRLSWTVQAGDFDSFLLQYKDTEGKRQTLPMDRGSRTVTVTNLAPSRRYKFNLYGIYGRKRLAPVSTDGVTAAAPTEEVPTPQPSLGELSASDITHDSIGLSWTVLARDFDSFLLQYKDAEGKPQALPVDGGSRTVTVTNLAPSRRYKFNLYGISGRKRLGPVSTDTVTAAAPTEEVPTPQPSLGELSASNVTYDSIQLSWTIQAGNFDSFLLQYKDTEGKPQALPMGGGSRTVTVTNLAPSRRYKFNLYGIYGRKRLGPVSTDSVTDAAPTEQVPTVQPSLGELSASNVTHDSIQLSWTVQAGDFDSFLLQYKGADGKPQALPMDGGSRTVTVTNLAPSRRYKFNLYGIFGRKRLGPVSTDSITAPWKEEPAPQPSLGELSASNVTNDSIRLSWTVQAGDFDSFLLQYKDTEGKPQALPVDGGSRTVTVTNLAPSRRYKFNLYGIYGRKRLGPVSIDSVTAAAPKDEVPTPQPSLGELSASDVTHDSIRLSWTVQAGDFDSFLLQYKDTEGKPQVLPVDGGSRTVTVTNLAPSRRYKFNLYGIYGRKRLGPLSTDSVTDAAPTEQVPTVQPSLGELSASNVTHDSIQLSWTIQAGDFDSFLLQYKDAEGKPQALPVDGGSRTVTVTNLAPSRRYKFNLYGIFGRKRLGPVSTDSVTAAAPGKEEPAPQPSLGDLSASDVTHDSIRLSWTVQAGDFDSFLLQYKDAEGKPQALPVDGGSRTVTVTNLAPSRRYKFNLYGISGRKRLGPVSTDTITAVAPWDKGAGMQLRLGELSASNVTHDSALLSWTVEEGTFDSFLLQYKDAEGKPQALPVDGGSRTVTVTSLAPSRRYKFNLYGIYGRKRLGPVSTDTVTVPREEGAGMQLRLGPLSASDVTHDSLDLSWTVEEGTFDSFILQYRDADGKPQVLPVDGGSLTVTVTNLAPSRRYKFNLYGVSGRKRLGPVSTDAVTAFPEASSVMPARLEQLLVSEVTPTSLRLRWDAPEGDFDTFLIRYRAEGWGPAQEMPVPGAQRSAVLRGLRPSTEYGLAVYGLRQGEETANVHGAARTSSLELESPRDLRFSDVRETSVGVTWGAPSTHVDHYKVSFQLRHGGEPQSVMVEGTRLQTMLEGLIPGASYEVSVMAVRGFEESEPLVGYVTTVPDGPSDLRAVNVADTLALLRWRPPQAPVQSYELSYGPPQGPSVTLQLPGDRAEHPLAGLRLDTEYLVTVHGVTGGNRSSPASATFTTGLDAPRDLRATEVTPRSARLSWTPPHIPPAGYVLSYETPSGQMQEIPLGPDAASHQLSNLTPSSRYQVWVQAIRGGHPSTPIATSFNTVWLSYPFPRDCVEEQLNGPGPSREVTIYLGGDRQRPLQVYCDMETDGGGWLVFQRRMNGQTDFWRDWEDYARGFGNRSQEFWLGNDALHELTAGGEQELRVDLRAGAEAVFAQYQRFRVDPPSEHYRLHLGSYRGTAGDALSYHSGSVFSTRDRDPNRLLIPCAVSYRGAWWYRNCHYANLNGLYGSRRDHQGVNWFNWKGFEFSIPFTEMKMRPRRG